MKAPKVKIDDGVVTQIQKYKQALEEKVKVADITSYCISTEISHTLQKQIEDGGKVRKGIYVFTWQEILDKIEKTYAQELKEISNKISMEDGYRYFQENYSNIFGNNESINLNSQHPSQHITKN